MSAYQRAFLYVKRKKGKTVLLMITFLIIMTLVLIGTAINRESENTAAKLREEIGGYFKIAPDYQKMHIRQTADQELVDQVMKNDGIKAFNTMSIYYLTVPELTLKPGKFTMEGDSKAQLTRFLGNTSSRLHEYFVLNIFTLTDGQQIGPSDKGKAMISKELARSNDIGVGDTFLAEAAQTRFQFEVAGIFDEVNRDDGNQNTPECDFPSNFIFIDETSAQAIGQKIDNMDDINFNGGVSFFVKDPKEIEEITNQVTKLDGIDWDSLKLTVNNTAYQNSVEPLTRLSSMTSLIVGIIVIISALLITMILALWERDRIHEAGVLMSFGISRKNILWQHFLECMFISLAAFLLAAVISVPVSKRAGQMLYEDSAAKTERATEDTVDTVSFDSVQLDRADVDVSLNTGLQPMSIIISGFLGIFIVSIAVGISFLVVVRCKPKDLLTVMD